MHMAITYAATANADQQAGKGTSLPVSEYLCSFFGSGDSSSTKQAPHPSRPGVFATDPADNRTDIVLATKENTRNIR